MAGESTGKAADIRQALAELVGKPLGASPWITVDQETISEYGRRSGDDGWIHSDPERARRESPSGGTIAQGSMMISLLTGMAKSLDIPQQGVAYRLNYGFDRVRFIGVVPVDSRIRGRFLLDRIDEKADDALVLHLGVEVEVEGADKPAAVADWLAFVKLEPES
jgi:acyl dehydratase